MIPDEAVEAATSAFADKLAWCHRNSIDPRLEDGLSIRAALEAAAPHMLDAEGAVKFDRPAGYKLPEPIVLPDLSDDKVWADLKKKAEQCERESRRTRRKYWLHQIFPWL